MRELARLLQELEVEKEYRFDIDIDVDFVDIWNELIQCDIVVVGKDEEEDEVINMIIDILDGVHDVKYYGWSYRTNTKDKDKYDYMFNIEIEM